MRSRTELRSSGGDDGFTLVELVIAILIIGVISVPLGNIVIAYLRNSNATTARLIKSHDVQIASTYWAQDVASLGMRVGPGDPAFATSPYSFKQSVALGTDSSLSSLGPCGTTGTPVVRLAWDDFSASGGKSIVQVAYVLSTPTELHRVRCDSTGVSDVTLTHDLDPSRAPTASCSPSCSASTTAVSLSLKIKDASTPDGTYDVVLTGQRRQS